MEIALSPSQLMITIFVIALGTIITRFLPFMIFPPGRKAPHYIAKLQVLLPSAAMGLLVVYSLKNINLFSGNRGLPELFATLLIVGLHHLFKNTLLSIVGGTIFYMLLVQLVF